MCERMKRSASVGIIRPASRRPRVAVAIFAEGTAFIGSIGSGYYSQLQFFKSETSVLSINLNDHIGLVVIMASDWSDVRRDSKLAEYPFSGYTMRSPWMWAFWLRPTDCPPDVPSVYPLSVALPVGLRLKTSTWK
jgi:hypothetical protein